MSELDAEKTKAFFASRTALWNIAGILAAWFVSWRFPQFHKAACEHKEVTVTLGLLLFTLFCSVNLWLRKVTHCRIGRALVWIGAILLVGCSSLPQKLDPRLQYRNDMPFCVEGYGCFEGATVLPRRSVYKFELSPKGDATVDFFVVTTCNRNKTFEPGDAGFTWDVLGLFGKKKSGLKYVYVPLPDREDAGNCDLTFHTYEKVNGRHAWAFIRQEHPKYTLQATIYCDGEKISFGGTSICQAKAGLIQWLEFPERVQIMPGKTEDGRECPMPKKDETNSYALRLIKGECGYSVYGESGRKHDLVTIGYEGELIRQIK